MTGPGGGWGGEGGSVKVGWQGGTCRETQLRWEKGAEGGG